MERRRQRASGLGAFGNKLFKTFFWQLLIMRYNAGRFMPPTLAEASVGKCKGISRIERRINEPLWLRIKEPM